MWEGGAGRENAALATDGGSRAQGRPCCPLSAQAAASPAVLQERVWECILSLAGFIEAPWALRGPSWKFPKFWVTEFLWESDLWGHSALLMTVH